MNYSKYRINPARYKGSIQAHDRARKNDQFPYPARMYLRFNYDYYGNHLGIVVIDQLGSVFIPWNFKL